MNKYSKYLNWQRGYDNRCPDEDDNWRICIICKNEFNNDTQELDSHGKDICDECLIENK